ncbi:MAG TPA: hypothetical protein VLL25_17215 [Acidimicrobiales bacterium]|nr:hypothetical protein [Acidimicrobiales bacterium]
MAIEDFANCYGNRVGGDVDTILDACKKIGVDDIRALVAAASAVGLGTWLSGITLAALEAYIVATLGVAAWQALVLLLGAVAWSILIDAFIHCVDQL